MHAIRVFACLLIAGATLPLTHGGSTKAKHSGYDGVVGYKLVANALKSAGFTTAIAQYNRTGE